jgi:hypothetical protein
MGFARQGRLPLAGRNLEMDLGLLELAIVPTVGFVVVLFHLVFEDNVP